MKRTSTIAVLTLAAALAGCQDVGLEGNIPLEEAEQAPPSDLVVAVHGGAVEARPLIVEGRSWVPSGLPLTLSSSELRPVGSADGRDVYARAWDRTPFDALYTRVPAGAGASAVAAGDTAAARDTAAAAAEPAARGADRWQAWLPVIGRSGAAPGPAGAEEAGHGPGPDSAAAGADHAEGAGAGAGEAAGPEAATDSAGSGH